MVRRADISFEIGHFYLPGLSKGAVQRRVREAATACKPLIDISVSNGQTVSTCFLVDDYSGTLTGEYESIEQLVADIREACEDVEIRMDYVVSETTVAEFAPFLWNRVVPLAPSTGDRLGTSVPLDGWLSDSTAFPVLPASDSTSVFQRRTQASEARAVGEVMERSGYVRTQVMAHNSESGEALRWSCPFLACVWQLMRLGIVPFGNGDLPALLCPAEANSAAFSSNLVVSVLPLNFMAIEHGVQVILEQVSWTDADLNRIRVGPDTPNHRSVIDRLVYLFTGAAYATQEAS